MNNTRYLALISARQHAWLAADIRGWLAYAPVAASEPAAAAVAQQFSSDRVALLRGLLAAVVAAAPRLGGAPGAPALDDALLLTPFQRRWFLPDSEGWTERALELGDQDQAALLDDHRARLTAAQPLAA